MERIIETEIMSCPLCEKTHKVNLVENDKCIMEVCGEKVEFKTKYYKCENSPEGNNIFYDGKQFSEELETLKKMKQKILENKGVET